MYPGTRCTLACVCYACRIQSIWATVWHGMAYRLVKSPWLHLSTVHVLSLPRSL